MLLLLRVLLDFPSLLIILFLIVLVILFLWLLVLLDLLVVRKGCRHLRRVGGTYWVGRRSVARPCERGRRQGCCVGATHKTARWPVATLCRALKRGEPSLFAGWARIGRPCNRRRTGCVGATHHTIPRRLPNDRCP